jgi:predicted NAD-dependent protein-ADP-ribosyltransferase YbiA (DUF1768 family)
MDAKRIGHKIKCDIKQWDKGKVDVMRDILTDKFRHKRLMKLLKKTDNINLVEGNWWHDNFWGNCICIECNKVEGSNYLRKLLMEIRDNPNDRT